MPNFEKGFFFVWKTEEEEKKMRFEVSPKKKKNHYSNKNRNGSLH